MIKGGIDITGYIYKICNTVNDKVYIGQTTRTIDERYHEHLYKFERPELWHGKIYRAMNKHGVENFFIEAIEECDVEKLNEREMYWVEYYDSYRNGYNANFGGDGFVNDYENDIVPLWEQGLSIADIVKETGIMRQTISSFLRRYGITAEEIYERGMEVLRSKRKTKQIFQYGMDGSYITCFESITDAAKSVGSSVTNIVHAASKNGRYCAGFQWRSEKLDYVDPIKLTDKDKIVELWKNGMMLTHIRDEVHCDMSTVKNVLIQNGYTDKDFKERLSQVQRIAATKYDAIYQYDFDGNYIAEYNSVNDASLSTNTQLTSIICALKGKQKSAGGFQWSLHKSDKIDKYKPIIRDSSNPCTKRNVYQYSLSGEYIQAFESVKDASLAVGLKSTCGVSSAALGNRLTAAGYQWSYEYIDKMQNLTKA